ncbi:sugar transferase [uncultured Photobacterium sp.]|uniref:sugar transferase n=1 Tax=uncultured Photobacterium sp. TaxID=173973 RepID=UPI0026195599|nr:sugar transferase [uncultured Photobacterium sp.]
MVLQWMVLIFLTVLIIYHHVIYTGLMIWLGRRQPATANAQQEAPIAQHLIGQEPTFPSIALVMPAHNEEACIEEKLANLLIQDYPPEKLSVWVCCDGCSDETASIVKNWQKRFTTAGIKLHCIEEEMNLGKVARLNQMMLLAKEQAEFIALSDVSALLSMDALRQAAASFIKPQTGAVTCSYLLAEATQGEQQYWQWQNNIRYAESRLGNVMGGNGAFYIMRAKLFVPLPEDTINDDFMLPMMVIKQGYQVQFNQLINSIELTPSNNEQNYQRRQRIGAGNLQQLIRCRFIFKRRHHGARWLFASGKGLRTLMPFILLTYLLISGQMAAQGSSFALGLVTLQLSGYLLALLPAIGIRTRLTDKLHYFISGYAASLIGMLRYLSGQFRHGWRHLPPLSRYQTQSTLLLKRVSDILLSTIGLIITLPLWPIIALFIKLDSPGTILYRQLRVGRISEEQAELFEVIKFRTMAHNAESLSGAVWASQDDPRITRIGRFLRATRLDELPQFINVLKGEMSLIGPRPERPELCGDLQNALPFYLERTAGLKPGITGLAQVNQGYDCNLNDVKNKIAWDHAYAVALSSPLQWLRMDLYIIFKTLYIMACKRGQ